MAFPPPTEMDFTETLAALAALEGRMVGVLILPRGISGPAPLAVMKGKLGAVEMGGEAFRDEGRGIACFPIGEIPATVDFGPPGVYLDAQEFEFATYRASTVEVTLRDLRLQFVPRGRPRSPYLDPPKA